MKYLSARGTQVACVALLLLALAAVEAVEAAEETGPSERAAAGAFEELVDLAGAPDESGAPATKTTGEPANGAATLSITKQTLKQSRKTDDSKAAAAGSLADESSKSSGEMAESSVSASSLTSSSVARSSEAATSGETLVATTTKTSSVAGHSPVERTTTRLATRTKSGSHPQPQASNSSSEERVVSTVTTEERSSGAGSAPESEAKGRGAPIVSQATRILSTSTSATSNNRAASTEELAAARRRPVEVGDAGAGRAGSFYEIRELEEGELGRTSARPASTRAPSARNSSALESSHKPAAISAEGPPAVHHAHGPPELPNSSLPATRQDYVKPVRPCAGENMVCDAFGRSVRLHGRLHPSRTVWAAFELDFPHKGPYMIPSFDRRDALFFMHRLNKLASLHLRVAKRKSRSAQPSSRGAKWRFDLDPDASTRAATDAPPKGTPPPTTSRPPGRATSARPPATPLPPKTQKPATVAPTTRRPSAKPATVRPAPTARPTPPSKRPATKPPRLMAIVESGRGRPGDKFKLVPMNVRLLRSLLRRRGLKPDSSGKVKVSTRNSFIMPAGHYFFPSEVRVVGMF